MFLLRGECVCKMRDIGFVIPRHLYRVDAFLHSAICTNFNMEDFRWDDSRALVCPAATFSFRPLSWSSPKDLWSAWMRKLRQSQGDLELAALRAWYSKVGRQVDKLLPSSYQIVEDWIAIDRRASAKLFLHNPLTVFAWKKMKAYNTHELRNSETQKPIDESCRLMASFGLNNHQN